MERYFHTSPWWVGQSTMQAAKFGAYETGNLVHDWVTHNFHAGYMQKIMQKL